MKDWLRYRYFKHKYGARVESTLAALTFTPGQGVVVKPGAFLAHSNVGAWTYIGYYAEVSYADVGPYCSIAPLSTIGANEHFMHLPTTSEAVYPRVTIAAVREMNARRTCIGPDVWIGAKAVVRKGVSVGVGAVVGAGAVVTSDVEPYDIVVGAPARRIRSRFQPELVGQLARSHWWECPHDDIRRALERAPDDPSVSADTRVREFLGALGKLT